MIEREERTLGRIKTRKEARKAVRLESGLEKSATEGAQRPSTTGTKAPGSRTMSTQPPKLSVMERKKMKANFNLALTTTLNT